MAQDMNEQFLRMLYLQLCMQRESVARCLAKIERLPRAHWAGARLQFPNPFTSRELQNVSRRKISVARAPY